jgi:hypothetical protein
MSMRSKTALCLIPLLGILAFVLAAAHCGDGGGGGGSGSARVTGNVSSGPSAALEPPERSWFAWIRQGLRTGLAFAQGAGNVDDILVTVRRGNRSGSTQTNASGDFDIGNAPTGDVTVTFQKDDCTADGDLPDVTRNSTITLEDVDVSDCDNARPARVEETFDAVVRNKPGSPNGNLNVCVDSGGQIRTRVVKIQDATFEDAGSGRDSFAELEEGDRITVTGTREGLGAPSALDATTVGIVSSGSPGDCEVLLTPTATPTGTPEETATPTPSPTPTS